MNRANVPTRPNVDTDLASAKCAVIDDALIRFRVRALVSGAEVVDFLLDLRGVVDIEMQLELLQFQER